MAPAIMAASIESSVTSLAARSESSRTRCRVRVATRRAILGADRSSMALSY